MRHPRHSHNNVVNPVQRTANHFSITILKSLAGHLKEVATAQYNAFSTLFFLGRQCTGRFFAHTCLIMRVFLS